MTQYVRGRAKEYAARDALKKRGALLVIRSAGSNGLVDLAAFFPQAIHLVQVKYTARKGNAWVDKNWKALVALELAAHVWRWAYVYRKGVKLPQIVSGERWLA